MSERQRKRADLTAQPHDAIIKYTFSQREHAAGLLQAALEPEIASAIHWDTLELEKIHFVDRTLRGRYADLLFTAKAGDERLYVHVLLEHQSTVDPLMIFRMGSTMWRRWEQLVRDEPTRTTLPLVIPILIHHSSTGWTAATAFQDLLAFPPQAHAAALRYTPRFELKLIDVSRVPSSGLVEKTLTALGRVVLWSLSVAGDNQRFETEIDGLIAELNALNAEPREMDAMIAVLRYLVATHPGLDVTKIAKLVETAARKGQKEVVMDRLDAYLHEQRIEGRVQGAAQMLLGMLVARFGSVPADAKARVLAAKEATLRRWSIRVLTEPTLEAVLATARTAKKPPAPRPAARKRPRPSR